MYQHACIIIILANHHACASQAKPASATPALPCTMLPSYCPALNCETSSTNGGTSSCGTLWVCIKYWTQSPSDRSQTTQCNNLHQMPGKPPASHEVIAPCRCAQALELTQMAKKGAHFRCPQHYCAVCRKSGDGVDMVKCIRCPTAYHSSCMPKDIQRLLPHAKVWPLLSPSTQICFACSGKTRLVLHIPNSS